MGIISIENLPSFTYDEYYLWKGDWELIVGIPYALSPAPSICHQVVSNNITCLLEDELKECKHCKALLPVDLKLDESTVLRPENSVVCYKPNGNYLTKAPSIIFEVLSKSTAKKDQTVKFEIYQREGVNYYVLVDPKENVVKLFELKNGAYIKMLDATDEVVTFDLDKCSFDVDFNKVFVE